MKIRFFLVISWVLIWILGTILFDRIESIYFKKREYIFQFIYFLWCLIFELKLTKWPGKNPNFQVIFISLDSLGSKTQLNLWNEISKKFLYDLLNGATWIPKRESSVFPFPFFRVSYNHIFNLTLDMYKSAVDEGVYANGVRPPVERSDSNYARNLRLINNWTYPNSKVQLETF